MAPRPSLWSTLAEPNLTAEERAAYELDCAKVSAPRVVLLLMVLVAVCAVVIPTFARRVGTNLAGPENYAELVVLIHGVALLLAGPTLAWSLRQWRRQQLGSQRFVDVAAFGLIVYAVAVSINGTRVTQGMTAWPGAALVTAVLMRTSRPMAVLAFAGTGLGMSVGAVLIHGPSTLGASLATTALGVAFVSWVTNRALSAGLAREVQQRLLIAAQQTKLEQLNQSLEQRVDAQVAEIRARAIEIERLNEHLRQQVEDRTEELRRALASASHGHQGLETGSLFEGRIEILALLGEGGMGKVYRGFDRTLGRSVAVKVLSSGTNDPAALSRFLDEASAAARVKHPGVVVPLHVDVTKDGDIYQVLELIEGLELSQVATPLAVPAVARIGAHIAEALAAAHAAGVVHRDVKAANVMLSRTAPGVRLLDFGVAKLQHRASSVTGDGQVVGTPSSMAPEQIEQPATAGSAVDVYALGILLFDLATGRSPFARDSLAATLIAHINEPAPPLACEPQLDALVATCLSKSPAARPSAAECARVLTGLADQHAAPAAMDLILPRRMAVVERTLDSTAAHIVPASLQATAEPTP